MNIGLLYFVLAAIVLIVIGVLRANSTLNSIYCEHDYVLVGRFIKHGQNGYTEKRTYKCSKCGHYKK